MGTNDVASSGLYQINNHYGNEDGKDNHDSHSYGIPWKNFWSYSFGDKSPPQPHRNFKHCLHLENKDLCLKIEGESAHASKRAKPRALIKVLKEIFEID